MVEKYRILVAEDEEDLCEILQFNLESEGYVVDAVHSAESALKKDLTVYDLLLLDVMMGRMSGFSLAQKVRKELHLEVPIIFLTAKNDENEILTGFNLGADDYITKPFSVKELQARVKTVLKRLHRGKPEEGPETETVGNMLIDYVGKRLIIQNIKIDLTRKEFEILVFLVRHSGRVFSRNDLLARIWENNVIVNERTVDVNIARLRKKMGECGNYIHNKSGFGYYFEV
ncbi:MAG: response regulator transcription factor [Prolixibacteraceae bacterium]|nr:MAG: Transcriptional regulatory protein YycF [Bacteroidetes bacterium ADurb.Bin123]HOF56555.1 response regulator transcription factor [Prolixibacteraceae bacterium]HOS91456.1 response regulator transcription factor [Prolixibacteraceae bacterium]HQH77247.1 response regulator transcription factor [Prolixibacteraceae bacterium]HQJ86688.1 response regulator transcription factor [Prolixibacteraceae bacterium]